MMGQPCAQTDTMYLPTEVLSGWISTDKAAHLVSCSTLSPRCI